MNQFKITKSAQDIQDDIFRAMSAEQKINMASQFFDFAKKLNPEYFSYGTRKTTRKTRENSR